ncbi:hypothetical protein [Adlercreutzia sp.]|uniref:hypothetical protein n=1 Tax=Adlercreutzia sp. TaxID=1872387 RepID=UPI003AEF8AE0
MTATMAMIAHMSPGCLRVFALGPPLVYLELLHGGKLRIACGGFQDIGLLGGQGVALGEGLMVLATFAGLLVLVVRVLAHGTSSLIDAPPLCAFACFCRALPRLLLLRPDLVVSYGDPFNDPQTARLAHCRQPLCCLSKK